MTSGRLLSILLAALLGCSPAGSHAQPASLSAEAQVSLLTILPGDAVHTEFGHSAIRVRDPAQGLDWLYSYGTFNFDDPLFVPKFTYGRLRYFLSVADTRGMLRFYERRGRPVIEHRLRLTPAQRTALFQFLQQNAQPENRYYAYDFLFDNCSTRIRDALIQALGDDVQFAPRPAPDATFRELLDRYIADRPLFELGFDLALGTPTDRRVTPAEATFLPVYLMRSFEEASVRPHPDSARHALTARPDTLIWVDGYAATPQATDWPLWLAWGLFALGAAWTGVQVQRGQAPGRAADGLLLAVAGVVGLVVAFLWFISEHQVTNQNWNLLWAWPTHLVAAVALWRGASGRWAHGYAVATAVGAAVVAAAWALWPQPLPAEALPLTLALALRMGWRGVAPRMASAASVPA